MRSFCQIFPGSHENKTAGPPDWEHNEDIYEKELASAGRDIILLKQRGLSDGKRKENKRVDFNGLKIIDFGAAATVPLALAYLADFGAEVIKVETHLRPDISRAGGPFYEARMGEIDQADGSSGLIPASTALP